MCASKELESLILNISKTIKSVKGEMNMSDEDKFEGLKKEMIDKNDKEYGEEVVKEYGEDSYRKSKEIFKNMSQEDMNDLNKIADEILNTLKECIKNNYDAQTDMAQHAALLHKEWISKCWGQYSKEAHINLTKMYVENEQFRKYYDSKKEGSAELLNETVEVMVKNIK